MLTTAFNGRLGIVDGTVTSDRVVLDVEVGPDQHQPHGIVHGGVWCGVVETAASVAGGEWYGDRGRVVGVANQTDFLRAAESGRFTATATPVHRGRLQQLWAVEIVDATGRMTARGQVRLQNLPRREDGV